MKYVKLITVLSIFIFFLPAYTMESILQELAMRERSNYQLVVAAQIGDLYTIKKLLPDDEERACVNARAGDEGVTALVIASQNGHDEVVDFLLEKKATPNLPTQLGDTALKQASLNGNVSVVQALLAAKADPNWGSPEKASSLAVASQKGNPKVLMALLQAKAHVNTRVRSDNAPEIIGTPLFIASQNGHEECIEILLNNGAITVINNGRAPDNVTPLMIAVSKGHYTAAQMLLARGAAPRQKDAQGRTAIQYTESLHMKALILAHDEDADEEKQQPEPAADKEKE